MLIGYMYTACFPANIESCVFAEIHAQNSCSILNENKHAYPFLNAIETLLLGNK